MNKNMRMFIVCVVFALISSCKYYASSEDLKNLEQNVEGKVKEFLNTKERIVSDNSTVYEIAEKLKEEELKDKKENKENVNLENKEKKEDSNKNDLKDNEDAKVLKPEPITLENKDPKLEIAETLKPKLPVVVKPVVKEKTEEEKAKDREDEELKRKRIEQYQKEEKARLERKKQREERRKLRESESGESFLEGATKNKILEIARKIDKITSDINSINPKSYFEERMEVSGKEVEDKVTGAIYDDITNSYSNGNSIYSEWSYDLEEESGLKILIDELEKARTELRSKIKEGNKNNEKNKNTVKISDIKEDLEKLKEFLRKLKEYLQSNANKEEIQKLVKCSIDPDSAGCQE
ncbi:hypothetical protein QIA20_05235 (plasmid) [Borreliella japonica]|uniref:hypothetical protein n=1 Tax=Borreliella japonica TaxID=34095 RepID=UPI003AB5EC25